MAKVTRKAYKTSGEEEHEENHECRRVREVRPGGDLQAALRRRQVHGGGQVNAEQLDIEQPITHDLQPSELRAISDERLLRLADHARLLGDGLKASLISEYVWLRNDHDRLATFKKNLSDRLTEEYVFAAETFAKSSYDKIYGGIRDACSTIGRLMGLEGWEGRDNKKKGKGK